MPVSVPDPYELESLMKMKILSLCVTMSLLAVGSANAEIIKGVMAIKGAEMS